MSQHPRWTRGKILKWTRQYPSPARVFKVNNLPETSDLVLVSNGPKIYRPEIGHVSIKPRELPTWHTPLPWEWYVLFSQKFHFSFNWWNKSNSIWKWPKLSQTLISVNFFVYFIILISFSLSLFLSFHFVSFPFHCLVWKWMERESEEEKKRRREWKWLGINWCTCGGICPELCRRGRRWYRRWLLGFRPRPLGGTPGKMFAVAVVVSPWPFLVLFLPLSNYFLFKAQFDLFLYFF